MFIPVTFTSNAYAFYDVVVNSIQFIFNVIMLISYHPHLDFFQLFRAGFLCCRFSLAIIVV